jgi:NADPH oxidase
MEAVTFLKKQLTGTKLLFNFFFWGIHFGVFAFGWYGVSDIVFN